MKNLKSYFFKFSEKRRKYLFIFLCPY